VSFFFFYRSNYWVRRKVEYQEPDQPRKKRKKSYKVAYSRKKAEAFPVNVEIFAAEISRDIKLKVKKRRKREEEVVLLLRLFDDI